MNKFSAIIKRVASGICVFLILFMIIYLVSAFLAFLGMSLPIDKTRQFLRQQSLMVLLEYGAFACAFIYLLSRSINYENRGDTNMGLAYCYGYRQMQERQYDEGILTFENDQLTFKPDNTDLRVFTLSYNRIIRSDSEWGDLSVEHALFPFCSWYYASYKNKPTYHVSIRYKDNEDNERVLEIGLPRYTKMITVVRQKLFNGKVEKNSCTA